MSTLDKAVEGLFQKLEERKKEYEALQESVGRTWKTNCTFPINGGRVNIQTADEATLREVAAHVAILERTHDDVDAILGTTTDRVFANYPLNDWKADLKKRFSAIGLRAAAARLVDIEGRLNKVLSPEERRRIEIERLAQDLSSDL